ncbi:Yip1 domain-containing protein, partial [Ramicandelaber brevisporus]
TGKVHFGYIYGVALFGCVAMYTVLNLMSESGIDWARTASVLGYCMLPMVMLSGIHALMAGLGIQLVNITGLIAAAGCVLWCTNSAAAMFVSVLSMSEQRVLVAYPVMLLYSSFALMTVL